jgi:uncharacterized protein YyaL (SSP411 family)
MPQHTNRLAGESSPYLLQHAHNPVDWYPWGDEAWDRAKAENKLVLVSIGYSSCHWCHVMERESFESTEVAERMNADFICIKVDREVRPDVDQVYMTAVQLMTGRGGWPLNCFTLPDGRPVYGGTYFPPEQWLSVLQQLADTWATDPERVVAHAKNVHHRVLEADLVEVEQGPEEFTRAQVDALAAGFIRDFDTDWGGPSRAPKFPLPNNYTFLLRYAASTGHKAIERHVRLTLHKMAQGGLFDQAGGGFARYSTDLQWKVPHFEKMLYDNAQLISLYSKAFQAYGDEAFRDVVERTIGWAVREMRGPGGAWHSALDADSEGEEGRFYTWTMAELQAALGEDVDFAVDYYGAGGEGAWEQDRNILLRSMDDAAYALRNGLTPDELRQRRDRVNGKLLQARSTRVRPATDDKAVTAWNGMMVSGLCDAHEATGNAAWLDMAQQTMQFLLTECRRTDGGLWHTWRDGRASVNGYLDDYSFTLEALLALYQVTFDEAHLHEARRLADYAIAHFLDERTGLFWYTSSIDAPLISRSTELGDNVAPASNSSMAKALFTLGHLLDDEHLITMAKRQLRGVLPIMAAQPTGFPNWGQLLMDLVFPWYEIAITGPEAMERRHEFFPAYIPGRVFLGGTKPSALPLLKDKWTDRTTIYVCENKVCLMPVPTVDQALGQLR